MRIDGHGLGDSLYTFRGVNNDPAFQADGPTAQRDVVDGASLKGFFKKFQIKAITSGESPMAQLLDQLKGDLSQENIDKWVAEHKDQLQQIGAEQGLSGEASALVRNQDGTWTVSSSDGESSTFALLDVQA